MILTILLPSLNKFWIYVDFKINQDFIAEVFCINKEEPILMCSGKCYLKGKLQAADDQEKQQRPLPSKEKTELNYYLTIDLNIPFTTLIDSAKTELPIYRLNYQWAHQNKVFHPPKFSS